MKVNVFDGSSFSGLLSKIDKGIVDVLNIYDRNNIQVQKKLDDIARTAIDDFYDSYKNGPHVYERTEDLYNTYKITVDDDMWNIQVGSEFMQNKHHQENDLVYWLSMKVGVHGGFPHNGAYYWRTPTGIFSEWYPGPAPYGPEDIESRILEEADVFIKEKQEEENKEVRVILDDIKNSITELI